MLSVDQDTQSKERQDEIGQFGCPRHIEGCPNAYANVVTLKGGLALPVAGAECGDRAGPPGEAASTQRTPSTNRMNIRYRPWPRSALACTFQPIARLLVALLCVTVQSGRAADISDDFSGGVGSWLSPAGWVLVEQASGQSVYRGDSSPDIFTKYGKLTLGASWRLEVDVRFRRYYADNNVRGLAAIALFPSFDSGVQFEANLGHRTNGSVEVDANWFESGTGKWSNVLTKDWTPNRSPAYRLHLFRAAGSDRLVLKVTSTNGFSHRSESAPIPLDFLNQMKVFGLRVNSSQVDFANLRVITPYTPPPGPVITEQPHSRSVSTGSSVSFRVVASGPGPLTYQWFRGAARLTVATNDVYTIPSVLPAHAASFSVVVSNGETTTTSSTAVLSVVNAYLRPAASARTNGVGPDGFALELSVPKGTNYVLQQTADLSAWSDLTNSVGVGSPKEFKVSGAINQAFGFYRLLFP